MPGAQGWRAHGDEESTEDLPESSGSIEAEVWHSHMWTYQGGRERREKRSQTQRNVIFSATMGLLLWVLISCNCFGYLACQKKSCPQGWSCNRWVQNGQDCHTRSVCNWLDCGPLKILVTTTLSTESIPAVTLIRTDTTLDHSQKAEKIWSKLCRSCNTTIYTKTMTSIFASAYTSLHSCLLYL